jgi:hypothetical protein
MASRKTYFGIGLPSDPSGPESGPVLTGGGEPEDRSAPTVVDDDKVAEGLAQLRNWYQGDGEPDGPASPAPAPAREAIPLGGLQARPTAVGHATAPAAAAPPRPVPPDPMRATMYGHDVHRFEVEIALAAAAVAQSEAPAAAPPPATTTALVLAAQASDELATIELPPRSPSGSFPLAPQGEAQRLQRPGGVRRTPQSTPRPAARVPLTSRVMFGAGALALAGAVVIWLQTENVPDSPQPAVRPPQAASAPTPSAALPREPIAPAATRPAAATESAAVSPGVLRAPAAAAARSPSAPAAPRAERRPAALVTTRRQPSKAAPAKAPDDGESAPAETASQTTEKEASDAIPLVPEHPRKKVEAAPEAPPRKKSDATKTGEPQRGKVRIGADGDETLPPSED